MKEQNLQHQHELLKDISTPTTYIRAGVTFTGWEWELRLPGSMATLEYSFWFKDIDEEPPIPACFLTEKEKLINEVFARKGLKSISYKQAALEALNEWEAIVQQNSPIWCP